ncbi:MAG: SDR family NAD(P)-dependent oxidoreductase [Holophagales bacterium]|jgi:3-oxoacyl-[acyl-carrier protein] reductase|nr:SDR family NAD(P)-dependent oxidoreductase [Holophagales bacterium]
MELKDAVALVTGAGRGIGRAVALALAGEGAHVALMGLTPGHLLAVEKEVTALGVKCTVLPGDVSDEGSVSRCVAAAEQQLGPIDILVNNAGVYTHGPVDRLDALVFDHTLAVNLRGPFLMSRAILPGMKSRRRGHVVNVASTAARRGFAGGAAYCASKFGLAGLSEAMLHDVRKFDVRVTCILPSTVATDMARRGDFLKDAGKAIRPEDVAQAIVGLLKLDVRVLPTSLELWQTNP